MEIVALLTAAKEIGFDIGQLSTLGLLYFMLRKDLMKVIDKQFNKLIDAIKSLEATHNKRIEVLEVDVVLLKKNLENVQK